MPEQRREEEEPVEAEETEASEEETDKKKQKDVSLRSGLSRKDTAPSAPRRFTPEEIAAYLKAQKEKRRSG